MTTRVPRAPRQPSTEAGRWLLELLRNHAPWFLGGSQTAELEAILAVEAEARQQDRDRHDEIRRRLDALPKGRPSADVSRDYADGYHLAVETVRLILDVVDVERGPQVRGGG